MDPNNRSKNNSTNKKFSIAPHLQQLHNEHKKIWNYPSQSQQRQNKKQSMITVTHHILQQSMFTTILINKEVEVDEIKQKTIPLF